MDKFLEWLDSEIETTNKALDSDYLDEQREEGNWFGQGLPTRRNRQTNHPGQ